MKHGFIKVAAAAVPISVADIEQNTQSIITKMLKADKEQVNILVLPELAITGYSCGDLFLNDNLIDSVQNALSQICLASKSLYQLTVVGFPFKFCDKLYNCAGVVYKGKIIGIVPKTNIPNYSEFYERRHFTSASVIGTEIFNVHLGGEIVPFGNNLIFSSAEIPEFKFGIEICEDLFSPASPSEALCRAGASIICNPSASGETVGSDDYRRLFITSASAKLICGYIFANADASESTQDSVFASHNIIAENGLILAESEPFSDADFLISEIDVKRISHERSRITSFSALPVMTSVSFSQEIHDTVLTRYFDKNPFVPLQNSKIRERAEAILKIQSYGLKKRIEHAHAKTAVIGISGGLDSTLALLVTVKAFELLGRDRKEIKAITMPCFGTTKRTKSNAVKLCEQLGVSIQEINITDSIKQHFADICHDEKTLDVTYENAQARERTQVLMDISNQTNGIVVGTGDLSELALGWATYNGDHMSMYAVNSSVPKTLVRYIVKYEADNCSASNKELADILYDILDTPVSPELLPADINGEISQKTEDIVGPYELHDFFLYHIIRFGSSPAKIFRLAVYVFQGIYDKTAILYWLKIFVRRFFTQQFKRSCMPDGPKVGTVSLSPRGDLRMPSDASYNLFLKELDKIKID